MVEQVPAYVAGFEIARELGRGGMGVVYLARHPRLGRLDAVKVLRPEYAADPQFRERFVREATLSCSLHHPNLVTVYDRGEAAGALFIATCRT
jgi:serine/threonine protein kinase